MNAAPIKSTLIGECRGSVVQIAPRLSLQIGAAFLHEKVAGPLGFALLQNVLPDIFRQPVDRAWQTIKALPLKVNAAFLHEEIVGPLGFAVCPDRFRVIGSRNSRKRAHGSNHHGLVHKSPHSKVLKSIAIRPEVAIPCRDSQGDEGDE